MRSIAIIAGATLAIGITATSGKAQEATVPAETWENAVAAGDYCQPACDPCRPSRSRLGGWQLRGGWLYLNRDAGDERLFNIGDRLAADDDADTDLFDNAGTDLATDNDGDDGDDGGFNPALIGNSLFDGDDLDMNWQSGFEVSLLRLPVRGRAAGCGCDSGCDAGGCDSMCGGYGGCLSNYGAELRYFQVTDWDSNSSFAIDDDDTILGVTAIQLGRDATASVRYSSDLYNAEANLLRETRFQNVILLGGFRYVHLDESFGASFTSPAPIDTASFAYDVDNDMIGGQIGALVNLYRGRFSLDGFGKAGIYHVNSDGEFALDSDTDFLTRDSDNSTGFLGELGITGGYQLTDCFGIESGYRLMWIDGVALASEQLSSTELTTGAYTLDQDGDLFYHGTTVQGVWTF